MQAHLGPLKPIRTMTKEEIEKLPRLVTERQPQQESPTTLPMEDQFDKMMMSLGNKFATYRNRCETALNEAKSSESYLMCAKFKEHLSCWDIAISDIRDLISAYRSGRAIEKAKSVQGQAMKTQNEQ